jgi:HK97 family phage prohead protease
MLISWPDESREFDAADAELRRAFTTDERIAAAKKGQAIPIRDSSGKIIGGRYPIITAEDLSNAVSAYGRGGSSGGGTAEIKRHIIKRARALGRMDLIPDSWKGSSGMRVDGDEIERRVVHLGDVDVRAPDGDGASGGDWYTVTGYAAVFNSDATLRDGRHVRLRERIDPRAFDYVLASRPDVHMLIGHDLNYPLARTGVRGTGSLDLNVDQRGLRVHAKLNPRVSYIRDLAEQMRDGVVDQMSFGFKVQPDGEHFAHSDLPDGRSDTLRTITRIDRLFDVTITPAGVYSDTSVALRSAAAYLGRDPADVFGDESGQMAVAPDDPAGGSVIAARGDAERAAYVARQKAHARARAAALRFQPTR